MNDPTGTLDVTLVTAIFNLVGALGSAACALAIRRRNHFAVLKQATLPVLLLSTLYAALYTWRIVAFRGGQITGFGVNFGAITAIITWPLVWALPSWKLHRATQREKDLIELAQARVGKLVGDGK